jgi:hypothetical protein
MQADFELEVEIEAAGEVKAGMQNDIEVDLTVNLGSGCF